MVHWLTISSSVTPDVRLAYEKCNSSQNTQEVPLKGFLICSAIFQKVKELTYTRSLHSQNLNSPPP